MIVTVASASRSQLRAALRRSSLRTLASLASAPSPSSSAAAPAQQHTKSWQPPIAPGVEPAYDEAIKVINEHQAALKRHIPSLKADVEVTQPGTVERAEAEALLRSYIVASQVDDPEVRWRFENDPDVPLSNPVFAHLREKMWRKQDLPRAIERVRLMSVVPDALPSFVPSMDVRVFFGQGAGLHDHGGEGGVVQIGCFVDPSKTTAPPAIMAQTFHTDRRLYTLALVDVDSPYADDDRLGNYAHWLVHNIPLSVTDNVVDVKPEQVALPYIAPHPQRGTKYHRYCLIMLEQSPGFTFTVEQGASLADATTTRAQRERFSLGDLITSNNLRAAGVHFWRAEWSEDVAKTVSALYRNVLKQDEPRYGNLPRRDRW